LKNDGYLAYITPDGIFRSSNKQLNIFKGHNIKYNVISAFDTTGYFDVGQDTMAWVLSKTKYSGKTIFNGEKIDLSKFPVIPKNNIELYGKVVATKDSKTLDFSTAGQINPKIVSESKTKKTPFALNANGKIKFSSEKSSVHAIPKVLIGQLAAWEPMYSDDMSATPATMRMLVDNEDMGKNLVLILKSKLYSFLIDQLRVSGRVTWAINTLPLLDLSRRWTDEEIFKYFKLTKKEIAYIEDQIN